MLHPPEQTRRDVVEILDNVPGLTARRFAQLLGHSKSSLERWRGTYRASNPPPLEATDGNVHLQGALLVAHAGLAPEVAIRLALGLVRLARLEQTLERLPGATAEMGDPSIREEIARIRAALEDADQAAPAIAWTRDHLNRLEAELDQQAESSNPKLSPAQLGLEREDELALFDATGLVAPPASLSVGELLQDADATARDLLFAPEGHQAAAMVRSWAPLVSAGAAVLDALPEPTGATKEHRDNTEAVQFAQELLERASSLKETIADRAWPANGPGDLRLDQITSDLEAAARMIRERPSSAEAIATGAGSPAEVADVNAARAAAIHALHMATHAIGLALDDDEETSPRPGHSVGNRQAIGWKKYVESLERFLAPELPGYPRAIAGMRAGASSEDRLPAALEAWRVQVNRALADHPTPASLALIAQVQGMTAAPTAILATAGVLSDEIVPERVAQACAESGPAWSNLADRWRDLAEANTADRALSQAAAELRAACRAVTHPNGPAAADELAVLPGIETAARALLDAASHGPEIAAQILEAADDPDLRGPARVMLRRTDEEAEEFGLTSYDRVTLTDLGHGLVEPTPLVRQALARTTHTTIRRAETLNDAAQIRSGATAPAAGIAAGDQTAGGRAATNFAGTNFAGTDLAATDLANVSEVAAQLAHGELNAAQLEELLEATKAWGAGLADLWGNSRWRTAKLDAAIAAIAEATAGLGGIEALSSALQQLEAAVAEARRLGEVIDDVGARGTFPGSS